MFFVLSLLFVCCLLLLVLSFEAIKCTYVEHYILHFQNENAEDENMIIVCFVYVYVCVCVCVCVCVDYFLAVCSMCAASWCSSAATNQTKKGKSCRCAKTSLRRRNEWRPTLPLLPLRLHHPQLTASAGCHHNASLTNASCAVCSMGTVQACCSTCWLLTSW